MQMDGTSDAELGVDILIEDAADGAEMKPMVRMFSAAEAWEIERLWFVLATKSDRYHNKKCTADWSLYIDEMTRVKWLSR